MGNNSSSNKRIAKNTLLLYFRQIITMVVSLYTSRIVLNTLGVTDYGIYNVVGGIVAMFAFLNSTMASASQRYLAFDIAQDNERKLAQTFSLTFLSYVIIAVLAFLLCELIAVWFLNSQMNIPEDRMAAANWVLQCSILMFVVNIMAAPYMSLVIARERMNVYAYACIADAVIKLIAVYLLGIIHFDKLKLYSVLMLCTSSCITFFYVVYCKHSFKECVHKLYFDKKRLLEMFSFAGWNVMGSVANILRSHGINIVLNLFFNPAVNAARGIAFQVNSAIASFSNNFYTAVRPQIIKTYASQHTDEMFNIIFFSSRLAFFLLTVISLPVLLLTDEILLIWLVVPPELASLFIQLTILNSLVEVLNFPLVNGLQACGKIRGYQVFISFAYITVLPISYILYKIGFPEETAMVVNIIVVVLCAIPRLWFCKRYIHLSIRAYLIQVMARVLLVFALSYLIGWSLASIAIPVGMIASTLSKFLLIAIETCVIIWLLGLTKQERTRITGLILNKIHKQ